MPRTPRTTHQYWLPPAWRTCPRPWVSTTGNEAPRFSSSRFAHMKMEMFVAGLVGVGVFFRFRVNRHHHQAAVANTTFGDHMVGQMTYMFRLPAQHRHLHAAAMVEMHMHGRMGQLVMVMEDMG